MNARGDYVLYWMIAHRRATWNFALQHAVAWSRELNRPLVVLEAVQADYPFASDRFHRFLLQGMAENARRLGGRVLYHPYVEPEPGQGRGLLPALARKACIVVTDQFPALHLPRLVAAAGRRLAVRLEQVDANGLLPLGAASQAYKRAVDFRRHLQRQLRLKLPELPVPDPLAGVGLPRLERLPATVCRRWPAAAPDTIDLAGLPLDHHVRPVALAGGTAAAERALERFVSRALPRYAEDRNHPDRDAASGLSPWLHFGHLASQQVMAAVLGREGWSPFRLAERATGARAGFWGASAPAEAFLDQLLTWRELGFNACAHLNEPAAYESLPEWAQRTLAAHARDPRLNQYDLAQFEAARTHDPLWNAAQRQLVREGRIHNYLRMLWGKKILEWSPSPQSALQTLFTLNDRYALDGRDPNSLSGIFWVLGRYDRPWGPERPIFGTVRYMSSKNTLRKVRAREYLARYTPEE
jgi:deoxyribodipyrimidine photo-lyase